MNQFILKKYIKLRYMKFLSTIQTYYFVNKVSFAVQHIKIRASKYNRRYRFLYKWTDNAMHY